MTPLSSDPMALFVTVFVLSSLAGLAELLRSTKPLTVRSVSATLLYEGLMGLAFTLSWWNWFQSSGNVWVLVGCSILAGLSSLNAVDVLRLLVQKLRIVLAINNGNGAK